MTAWLVVNADDLGVSKGATLGIIKAHSEGIVTSASLAVTTPFYQHAVESCVRAYPALGIGLHFTLTSGRPASRASDAPLLVNEKGFLRWRFLPLLIAASRGKNSELLDQIEAELEAQLARLAADGIKPDHIDGERHVHLIPGIFERVVSAARRHGIPYVRAGVDTSVRSIRPTHVPRLAAGGGFAKWALLSLLSGRDRKHLRDGVASADRIASYLYTGRIELVQKSLLEGKPIEGVTEMMVHPGIPEESLGIDLGNSELERYLVSEDRRREMDACISVRGHTGGWTLANFRELAHLRDNENGAGRP